MEKMTFRQKIENFWYHNKVAVIVTAVFGIFILVSLIQIFTKKSPDANFLYMGPASVAFSGEQLIQQSMAEIMKEDYNGDGERYIDYIELTSLDTSSDIDDTDGDFATGYSAMQVQKTVGESFSAQIIAGDSMIYLLDEQYFNVAKQTGVLMPLSEALGYTPDFAVNEYAVRLADLDVYYLPGLKLLPDTTLICIRYPVTLTSGKKKVEERERCNLSVFRDMFSYVYEDKPVEPEALEYTVMTLDEFKTAFEAYSEKNKLSFSSGVIDAAEDVTPEGFYDETGANLFRIGTATYLAQYGEIYALGKYIGGTGISDIAVGEFNSDSQKDLIFAYSYKSGDNVVSSLSVYDMTAKKETFLSVSTEGRLTITKVSDTLFEIYSDGTLFCTVEATESEYRITYK